MSWKCGRCGKPIKKEESVRIGLGPVCRKILFSSGRPPKEFHCHHGFGCLPSVEYHIPVLLKRAKQRYSVYGIEWNEDLERNILEGLGINRPRVKINLKKEIEQLKREHLRLKGSLSYRDEVILTKEVYRRNRVCFFGLDCRDPEKALESVYGLIALAINHMETQDPNLPLLDAIDPLIDILQILGFSREREHFSKMEKELAKQATKKAARAYAENFVKEIMEGL